MDVPTIPARSIVIKNKSTAWFGTRYTMNIYRGLAATAVFTATAAASVTACRILIPCA